MTLVLSDEPKAIVLAAERLLDLSANIRKHFTIDELAFKLQEFMTQLRAKGEPGSFIGTAGFYVFYLVEDGVDECMVMLNVTDFHRHTDPGEVDQQFHHNDGPWAYDESCPEDWRDE